MAGDRTEAMVVDVAVVTGGAGGLGQFIARELADHGLRVVIADTDQDAALELVGQLQTRGSRATFIHTDASDAAAIEQLMAQVADLGLLRVLVNQCWRLAARPAVSRSRRLAAQHRSQLGHADAGRRACRTADERLWRQHREHLLQRWSWSPAVRVARVWRRQSRTDPLHDMRGRLGRPTPDPGQLCRPALDWPRAGEAAVRGTV